MTLLNARRHYGHCVKIGSLYPPARFWINVVEFWNILCGSIKLNVANSSGFSAKTYTTMANQTSEQLWAVYLIHCSAIGLLHAATVVCRATLASVGL